MKAERAPENMGGGSGTRIFRSEMFWVSHYNMSKAGRVTAIRSETYGLFEVNLLGHIDIKSDEDCIEQLTAKEIVCLIAESIAETQTESFREGQESKAREMRELLGL